MSRPLNNGEIAEARRVCGLARKASRTFFEKKNPTVADLDLLRLELMLRSLDVCIITLPFQEKEDAKKKRVALQAEQKPPDPPVAMTVPETPTPPEGDLWFRHGQFE